MVLLEVDVRGSFFHIPNDMLSMETNKEMNFLKEGARTRFTEKLRFRLDRFICRRTFMHEFGLHSPVCRIEA